MHIRITDRGEGIELARRKCLDRERYYKLFHVSWGSDRNTFLHLHVALILSTPDYGCRVYSSASLLTSLDPVHRLGS